MNPCGTILVTNNFSPTHQARESQPPVLHPITFPTAPFPLLCTNKPIMATDINWIPFRKMLPQPFFSALPSLVLVSLPTRHTVPTHVLTHTGTQMYAHAHCGVYSVCSLRRFFCPLAQLGFSHLYIPLASFFFHGIQVKNLF